MSLKPGTETFTLDGDEYTIKNMFGEKAILITTVDGDDMWLPKSQLEEYNDKRIIMSAWIAKQKGLI
jgi:hypothetical protein